MRGGKQSSAKSAKKRKRNTEADTVQAKRLRAAKTDLFKSLQKKVRLNQMEERGGCVCVCVCVCVCGESVMFF